MSRALPIGVLLALLVGAAASAQPVLQQDPGRRGLACRLPAERVATGVCYDRDCSMCRNPRTNVCYRRNVPVRCPRILTEVSPTSPTPPTPDKP